MIKTEVTKNSDKDSKILSLYHAVYFRIILLGNVKKKTLALFNIKKVSQYEIHQLILIKYKVFHVRYI